MNRWGAIMAMHKAHGRNLIQETRANEGIVTPFVLSHCLKLEIVLIKL